jgi:hypothetical protein
MIEFEEEIPVPMECVVRKKKCIEDMVKVDNNITEMDLKKYTLVMLKEIVGRFKLRKKGNKADLVQRILNFVKSPAYVATQPEPRVDSDSMSPVGEHTHDLDSDSKERLHQLKSS